MTKFEELKSLSDEDTEYKMLIEVTKEYPNQTGSPMLKSGKATQIAIHNCLPKDIRLPQNVRVKIKDVKTGMNLLYLIKTDVDQNRKEYSVKELDAVLKISNSAVVGKKKSEDIKTTFDKFKQKNKNLRFATIILSERLSYPDKIIYPEAEVYALVFRKKRAKELYLKKTIEQLKKDGELRKPEEKGLKELLIFLKSE
ncbi:MAG: hypothetical protein ABSG33_07490 [Candidatus Bathyarchaeia archaeon]|jgi:hypothetical protein